MCALEEIARLYLPGAALTGSVVNSRSNDTRTCVGSVFLLSQAVQQLEQQPRIDAAIFAAAETEFDPCDRPALQVIETAGAFPGSLASSCSPSSLSGRAPLTT